MWKITDTITSCYPFAILELTNITSGEKGLWAMADGQSEDILTEYNTRELVGIVLDDLPRSGGWISEEEIRKL